MSKLLTNQAFDRDYETILESYFKLQERAQYSMDAKIAGQAFISGEDPEWQ